MFAAFSYMRADSIASFPFVFFADDSAGLIFTRPKYEQVNCWYPTDASSDVRDASQGNEPPGCENTCEPAVLESVDTWYETARPNGTGNPPLSAYPTCGIPSTHFDLFTNVSQHVNWMMDSNNYNEVILEEWTAQNFSSPTFPLAGFFTTDVGPESAAFENARRASEMFYNLTGRAVPVVYITKRKLSCGENPFVCAWSEDDQRLQTAER